MCLLVGQQVDILVDRFLQSPCLHLAQHLLADSYLCGNTLDLLQINLAVAFGHELGSGIADAIDMYGEDAHGATGDGDWTLRKTLATDFKLNALFVGQVLQTLIVVDEDKCLVVTTAV